MYFDVFWCEFIDLVGFFLAVIVTLNSHQKTGMYQRYVPFIYFTERKIKTE